MFHPDFYYQFQALSSYEYSKPIHHSQPTCLSVSRSRQTLFDCQTIFGKRYGLRPYNRKLRKKGKKKSIIATRNKLFSLFHCVFQVYFHTFVKLDFKVEYYIIYHLFQAIY